MAQAQRKTTDEKFNAGYAKRGLQPFNSKDGRIRNVQKQEKTSVIGEAANDPVYAQPAQSNVVRFPQPAERVARQRNTATRTGRPATVTKLQKTKVGLGDRTATMARRKAKVKAKAINRAAFGPLLFSYIFFQLPFAVISLILLGFAYISLEIKDAFIAVEEGIFGWVFKGIRVVAETVGGAVSGIIADLTGGKINLGAIFEGALNLPENFLIGSMTLIFGYGILLMLTLSLIYMFLDIKPLSGKGFGGKAGALILCLFGYFWPIFNLFPWIFAWTYVVGKNPT